MNTTVSSEMQTVFIFYINPKVLIVATWSSAYLRYLRLLVEIPRSPGTSEREHLIF